MYASLDGFWTPCVADKFEARTTLFFWIRKKPSGLHVKHRLKATIYSVRQRQRNDQDTRTHFLVGQETYPHKRSRDLINPLRKEDRKKENLIPYDSSRNEGPSSLGKPALYLRTVGVTKTIIPYVQCQ